MKEKLNADKTLELLIGVIKENLDELYCPNPFSGNKQFVHGEKTAYVECLEIVQYWERAEEYGLCGAVERDYPI